MKAPFPYFGGKSKIAPLVWDYFHDVKHYNEPFFGSGAVLLQCPKPLDLLFTINDKDGFVANFWRAIKADPDTVAKYADNPVNEIDLHARHVYLVNHREALENALLVDPDYYDARLAGWWAWGACVWIGSGWCSGHGCWNVIDGAFQKIPSSMQAVNKQLPHLGDKGKGVNKQLPHLGNKGKGVNKQLPHLGDKGTGVNKQLPHLGDKGTGVNKKLPHLGDKGTGVNKKLPHLGDKGTGVTELRTQFIKEWMRELQDRLRHVRVACGDWKRIVKSPSVTTKHGVTGIFLDPPYSEGEYQYGVGCKSLGVAQEVNQWCIDNGHNPLLRIILCGVGDEHDNLLQHGWSKETWQAGKGYSLTEEAKAKRKQESIWISPHTTKGELRK